MRIVLPLLADWANGIFAVLLASLVTGTEVLWWHFIIGVLFSHLPDIDAIPELLRRGKVAASAEHPYDHRTLLHYPLLSVPLSIVLILLLGYWGWVLLFAIVLHLLNDFYGTGWGVPALWPFTRRSYKLLGRRANRLKRILIEDGDWEQLPVVERRLRLVVSWSPEELPRYIARWGVDDWFARWYLQPNWVMVIEYGLFVGACIAAYLTLAG